MKIQFIGATREVTGSKHLITTDQGKKILLDCGMFQGKGLETDAMNRDTIVDPADVDHIILTHAHIDHSGLIPYFYKEGFRGSVICTHSTRDLCAIMLMDSAFIQENDTIWFNKKRAHQGLPPVQPIYTQKDVQHCMELFITTSYNRKFYIDNNIRVKFNNTGHMLGSAVATIEIEDFNYVKRIAYTGDVGRDNDYLLKNPNAFPQCDYLLTESTYGNRLHQTSEGAEEKLLQIVHHTCIEKRGKLIIPSFAIGRTQEVVYLLHKFRIAGKLPNIPIYVDSPLAVNATEIFRLYTDLLNDDVAQLMQKENDPFGFDRLHYIKSVNDSKKLNTTNEPCIIISASGMMEAGRIKHHLANNISNPRNSVLAVGYCAPETLGAKILRGDSEVSIFGTKYEVKAAIYEIDTFSGHADYEELTYYLLCQDPKKIRKTFLVHGEYEAQKFLAKHLKNNRFENIEIPKHGDIFELD
ncbi:MAG: MBL fold metallo-hydrolase [Lentimicrobiaceae bacterium]|jgi:metallo-beta-lactamase family protein|nr:MBL fold metallo-hydrolase [Lentimicrobiaceae bacterium]